MSVSDRPKKTALLVAQRIVADINARGNNVGDRLPPERVMLEDYDVGRGTLRESLRFLELQGVITLKPGPNGGPIVQQPDSTALATSLSLLLQFSNAPFETILETRVALEPAMAGLAAKRMDADGIAALREILAGEREAVDHPTRFLTYTRKFHTALAAGSGNMLFAALFDALVDILDGSNMGVQYPERERQLTLELHGDLVDAIEARDVEQAERLMGAQMRALAKFTATHHGDAMNAPIVWRT